MTLSERVEDSIPEAQRPTLADCYCTLRRINRDQFQKRFLAEVCYPQARPWLWISRLLRQPWFTADVEAVKDTGSCRSQEDVLTAITAYRHHPMNRGALRRWLRVRISARRVLRVSRDAWRASRSAS